MTKNDKQQKTFSISNLAEEFEISTRTIRFYEEKGLICPGRTEGNQRIYTRKDRARLILILKGRKFGYSIDEIAEIIGLANIDLDEIDQIRKTLEFGKKRLTEIRERISELKLLEEDIVSFHDKAKERLEKLLKEKE
ncbi:MAG: MerR family transcriptional regulator [Desulfobacteraceae bacterium]|nr:MerR family transcriptional regulator [Desulfobacteraceae bacterium]MCB9494807.1 MerR family transcriptional regulator [Desulfobacteraceae bacterium]